MSLRRQPPRLIRLRSSKRKMGPEWIKIIHSGPINSRVLVVFCSQVGVIDRDQTRPAKTRFMTRMHDVHRQFTQALHGADAVFSAEKTNARRRVIKT